MGNMLFEELDLGDKVLDALWDMNFSECTPIQEKAIPIALEGNDILGIAQTGTGKTAAYLLPVIDQLSKFEYPSDSVNCLIMVPTRELAQQIDRQLQGFSYFLPISGVAIYGGTDGHQFSQQERGLRSGADIVIATPGRLIALIKMGNIDLSKVSFFILDEADRMLDMGFVEDILQIERLLPKERQTLLFSATMPPKIKKLASKILNQPIEIKFAVSKPAEGVKQSAFICHETQKISLLKYALKTFSSKRVIIFASTKQKVKLLVRELKQRHYNAEEIHSDLDQSQRDNAMLDFRSGKIDILVATDILSRGIDIDDIQMVVNYDVPREEEDYVHRVGRTARANAKGIALTLVNEEEQSKFGIIEKFIEAEIKKEIIPEELGEGPEYKPDIKRSRRFHRGKKRNFNKSKTNNQNNNAKTSNDNRSRRHVNRRRGEK